jgi:hypothetical protein
MKTLTIVLCTLALSVGLATGVAVGRQTRSTDDGKAEVRKAFDEYYRIFSDERADLVAERVYGVPRLTFGATAVGVQTSRDAVEASFAALLKSLVAQGYERSVMPEPNICVPNSNTAIVSGKFVRYRKDGSVMVKLGSAYIFGRTPDGWRIFASISHAADYALTCKG